MRWRLARNPSLHWRMLSNRCLSPKRGLSSLHPADMDRHVVELLDRSGPCQVQLLRSGPCQLQLQRRAPWMTRNMKMKMMFHTWLWKTVMAPETMEATSEDLRPPSEDATTVSQSMDQEATKMKIGAATATRLMLLRHPRLHPICHRRLRHRHQSHRVCHRGHQSERSGLGPCIPKRILGARRC